MRKLLVRESMTVLLDIPSLTVLPFPQRQGKVGEQGRVDPDPYIRTTIGR
jgi:hypothetical protein